MVVSYTSCTTTEIDEPGVYAEVKVLINEQKGYDPLIMLNTRIGQINAVCREYVGTGKSSSVFNPTELAEWLITKLENVREVGVFNADGSGVIVAREDTDGLG